MEVPCAEALQYRPNVFLMFGWVVRIDEDIIQIDDDVNVGEVVEDVVHEVLKGGWSVGKPRGHHQIFEKAVAGVEGSFPLVAFSNADIIVTGAEVDFSKDFRSPKLVDHVTDQWNRIAIFSGYSVETTVGFRFLFMLFNEQQRPESRGSLEQSL